MRVGVGSVLLALVVTAGLAGANPVLWGYLSEISTDTVGGQWVELHDAFDGGHGTAIDGWVLRTTTSVCTLNYYLDDGEYLVVDSASLASGRCGSGKLHLDADGDTVSLRGGIGEVVFYPPHTPPPGGSLACWASDTFEGHSWYVDSTSTKGEPNDNGSSISGKVMDQTGQGRGDWMFAEIGAYGPAGWNSSVLNGKGEYYVGGLNPGRYAVSFYGYRDGTGWDSVYPDSVEVGYSENRTDINFIFDLPVGIGEPRTGQRGALPALVQIGRSLRVVSSSASATEIDILDNLGRHVALLFRGLLGPGVHEFRVLSGLPAGVYFARLQAGEMRRTAKVVVVR